MVPRCICTFALCLVVCVSLLKSTDTAAADFQLGTLTLKPAARSMKDLKYAGVVNQSLDYTCGPAALATLMTSLGTPVSESDVLEHLLTDIGADDLTLRYVKRQGFSLLDLKKEAERAGFAANAFMISFEVLSSLKNPAVIFLHEEDSEHFSVLRGVDGYGKIHLADPYFGNVVWSQSRFIKAWTKNGKGVVLVAEKIATQENPRIVSSLKLDKAIPEVNLRLTAIELLLIAQQTK